MDNYFTVYDFMVNELHLSGCDLLCYALIHSFTLGSEDGCYLGGQAYIAQAIGANRKTVNRSLSRLAQAGLIEVTANQDNQKIKRYVAKKVAECVSKSNGNLSQKVTDTCPKKSHNNNKDINNDIIYHKSRAQKRSEPSFDLNKAGEFSY